MKKLIKKGQRGITIGGKPLHGYYYSSAKATPGKVDENGFQELAELEVYRPDFYNDISQHAPSLWNYIGDTYKPFIWDTYEDSSEYFKREAEKNNQKELEKAAEDKQNAKRNLAAVWNAGGRPKIVIDKDTKIAPAHGNMLTNTIVLSNQNEHFLDELSHFVDNKYFNRSIFDSWGHIGKSLDYKINRFIGNLAGLPDFISGQANPENNPYSEDYEYAPYSEELSTHKIVQPILENFLQYRWGRRKSLLDLSNEQKYLLHDNLRNSKESLEQKYRNLQNISEIAKKMADKLHKENK